jgi:hypothetical protein
MSKLTDTQSQQRYQVSGFVEPAGQFGGREGTFVGLGDRLDLDLAMCACFANGVRRGPHLRVTETGQPGGKG